MEVAIGWNAGKVKNQLAIAGLDGLELLDGNVFKPHNSRCPKVVPFQFERT